MQTSCQQQQLSLNPPAGRTQVIAAAVRKKPGRVAGKQAGSTYYQNYLRNRQQRGGQFLGPPLLLDAIQPQQQQQQQQQQHWQDSLPNVATGQTAAQPAGLQDQQRRQHQQQQQQLEHERLPQQQQQQLGRESPQATAAGVDPAELQQLLQSCLAAVVAPLPTQPSQQQGIRGLQQQQQQQQEVVTSRLEQQRKRSKQGQPWQLPDYVRPELADSMVRLLKRKGGVVVAQPQTPSGAEPLIPLPPLPAVSNSTHTASATSNAAAATTNSSGSSDTAASSGVATQTLPARRRVQLHVFWDLSSLHPGGYDPRVLVAQLRRVLGCYGPVAGVYAFGIQKLFNWIPEAFMLQYAPDRLPGRRRNQLQQQQQYAPSISIHSQQREVQQLLQQAKQAGVSLEDSLGPLRCRVCGKLRDNYKQLHAHMVQRHKQAAPPLEKLLPEGALAPMLAAAIAAAGSSNGSSSADASRSQPPNISHSPGAAGPAAARERSQTPNFTWKVADPFALRNSSTRTLGRVSRYFNSLGEQFIPPDSHQISLKYVLVREGVEVRTVQRAERAVSAAVTDALHQTLRGELLARSAEEVQQVQDVLVVVSDKGTHAGVLREARKWGVPSIAVCGKVKRYQGADVTLRWQWVAAGRYDCDAA